MGFSLTLHVYPTQSSLESSISCEITFLLPENKTSKTSPTALKIYIISWITLLKYIAKYWNIT